MKPRIFISAVTKELRSARQIVANTLIALGYEPIWQDIFDTSGEDIRAMLRKKVDSCSAVLQIVGEAYGAEPRAPDEKFGRVSYTQYEALYARSIGKKVYYLIASNDLPRDAKPESIDVPRDDSDAARGDADQRRQLQREYLASIQSTGHIYFAVQSNPETELAVRRLKDELDRLRRGFRNWMIGVSVGLIGIALGIAWLSGGMQNLLTLIVEGQKKTEERIVASGEKTKEELKDVIETAVKELTNPSVLAERIRKEIHAASEAKINALPDQQGRGRLIADIEKDRDLALGRVEDLIKLIQEGLKEGASPVFQRAADILQKEGTDEALAYLESRRQSTLDDARRHADQAKASQAKADSEKELRNKSLQALVLEAELLESKLQWELAIQLREQIADLAPDWIQARNQLGLLYLGLARFQKAEPHFREALKFAKTDTEAAGARNNLAELLSATNRPAEAEPLIRGALEIDERHFGPVHPYVALKLNNLAQLLQNTNRLVESELLMRRALAIYEKCYAAEHSDVALTLNNLASLLQATNRMAEAEPLFRQALTIDEKLLGLAHPDVGNRLNNLAMLLQATNRMAAAEPLYRRALAIDEQSYGVAHPNVARDLSNLATLLTETNRLTDAEPLLRRALDIDEQLYGLEHPNVAIKLSNLARVLGDTNRLTESETLVRRALEIDERSSGPESPKVAVRLWAIASLLIEKKRFSEAVVLMRRALSNYQLFAKTIGNEHPLWKNAIGQYRSMLADADYSSNRIEELADEATKHTGPLTAIGPEVERMLGPAQSVADVLAALDRQYKLDGKPDIYFLTRDQPIVPHLHTLLIAKADALNAMGVISIRDGKYADAVVLLDETRQLQIQNQVSSLPLLLNRTNRAAALRDLGGLEQARDELRLIVADYAKEPAAASKSRGRAYYHLAVCEWRLGDSTEGILAAEESRKAYEEETGSVSFKQQTEKLMIDLKNNQPPPPRPTIDFQAAIASARKRYEARIMLAALPLNQSALPLVDQLLGPTNSIQEVLDLLDRQYREVGKPDVWFLPLSEPIAPHLEELLGPLSQKKIDSFDNAISV